LLQGRVEAKHQAVFQSARDLLFEVTEENTVLETGSPQLDLLLQGGLTTGEITEFVGPSAVGKTQLCLTIAAQIAIRGASVVYVDTTHSFTAPRVSAIMQHIRPLEPLEFGRALSRIRCLQAFDVADILATLESLREALEEGQDASFMGGLRLVVIDSLAGVMAPVLGGGLWNGHALMVSAVRTMKALATKFFIAFIVTNHTVSHGQFDNKIRPALGETWTYFADVRLSLSSAESKAKNSNRTRTLSASVHKCRRTPVGLTMFYEIGDFGFRGVG